MKKFVIGTVIVIPVGCLALYIWGAYYFSSIAIAAPQRSLVEVTADMATWDVDTMATWDEANLPEPEEVTLSVDEGTITLAGWLFEHPEPADCGVILLHGWRGARVHMLVYTEFFWERGCNLLLYDARHHGDSSGEYMTYGYHEHEDALEVLSFFAGETGLETSQIGLFGVSYGGATALLAAAKLPDVAFVAADSPYSAMSLIVNEQATNIAGDLVPYFFEPALKIAEMRADFEMDAVVPSQAAAEIAAPILLIHAAEDPFTQHAHSQRIFDAANPERSVLHLTDWGVGHTMSVYDDRNSYAELIHHFLNQHVSDFGR